MNKLTATESFLFSLTDSVAKTIPAQRAAIEREGLSRYTTLSEAKARQAIARKDREVEKARQRHLVELFRDQVALNPGLPHWVIACRLKEAPAKVEKGSLIISEPLAKLSYDRTRTLIGNRCKLSTGEVRRIPGVRETDNGKWGWDKVVWRYADYFCALSPHGRQVAFQLTSHDDIHLKSLLNGNIMFAGERLRVFPVPPPYPSTRLKPHTIVRALQNHAHGLTVSWDRSTRQAVLSHGSEQYHTGVAVIALASGAMPWIATPAEAQVRLRDLVVTMGGSVEAYAGNFSAVTVPAVDSTDHVLSIVGEAGARGAMLLSESRRHSLELSFDGGMRQAAALGFRRRDYAPREWVGSASGRYSQSVGSWGTLLVQAGMRGRAVRDRPPMPLFLQPGYSTVQASVGVLTRSFDGVNFDAQVDLERADYRSLDWFRSSTSWTGITS